LTPHPCPACGARLLLPAAGGALVRCPHCGHAFRAAEDPAAIVIDVAARPIGDDPAPEPVAEPAPDRHLGPHTPQRPQPGAPHIEDHVFTIGGPGGPRVFGRTITMQWGNQPPQGNGCCGLGCLFLVAFAIFIFIRGCASLF